jgi:hypothetical protein
MATFAQHVDQLQRAWQEDGEMALCLAGGPADEVNYRLILATDADFKKLRRLYPSKDYPSVARLIAYERSDRKEFARR